MLRVASVPATHVYVRRLDHPEVERLTDPSGDDLRTPCFLDPDWLTDHADTFDLLHVHFGFEFYDPQQLERAAAVLHELGRPLVYTCHDLVNPNHETTDLHEAALDVWMRHADAVVTLTPWAARRIRERHGRDAVVLPHPHVVPLAELTVRGQRPRPQHRDRFRFALHFKSLRPNVLRAELLRASLDAIEDLDGVRLRVDLHCDVADPTTDVHDPELVDLAWRTVADRDSPIDLHVHHYSSDDELWDHLAGADAFILPYRYGTHSGLLEACRDLGTAVVAPDCGGYADQGARHTFRVTAQGELNVESYRRALRDAVTEGAPAPLHPQRRDRERQEVAHAHVLLYRELLGARRAA